MMPIPKRLMPSTMSVSAPDTKSTYGGRYLPPTTVGNVRFERKEALNPRIYQLSDGACGRIWVDAINSQGAFEIPRGSLITIGNREMVAVVCVACETYCGKVHHWEIDVK